MPTIEFVDEQHKAKIKVIGVGGCGCNVVEYLCSRSVSGVRYAAINTDAQVLARVGDAAECVQIGQSLTRGLGAGANPEVAAAAARQEVDRVREMVGGFDMVFIAAGMGKGTGTGAAPIVAEVAREEGALTVAVVTRPFEFENRARQAEDGLTELAKHVDSLIVVPNNKLFEVLGRGTTVRQAFESGINVLYNAVCGISEIITKPGIMNVDFNDVRSVMQAKGKAVIGSASAAGDDRATAAANEALRSPLMEDVDLSRASHVLVNITGHPESVQLGEVYEIQDIIREHVPNSQNAQFTGLVYDESCKDELRVTIIVTGVRAPGQEAFELVGKQPPTLDYVRNGVRDSAFQSGRKRQRVDELQQQHGGNERKIPTVLRRQAN